MPVYECHRCDVFNQAWQRANLAWHIPGHTPFFVKDALGRNWVCVKTQLSGIADVHMIAIAAGLPIQSGAHEHILSTEGGASMMVLADDDEDLSRKLVLATYPPREESMERLRQAGWSKMREHSGTGDQVRATVSHGSRSVEAEGGNSTEAWYRLAEKAQGGPGALLEYQPIADAAEAQMRGETAEGTASPDEAETLRLQLLAEAGEVGEGTGPLDALLDRAHLADSFFEEHVLQDPACLRSPELFRAAWAVAQALADFYQRVGQEVAKGQTSAAEAGR